MLSVVLAAYNGEQFIAAQLESILAQLGSEDEVIVSDDSSTDGTQGAVRRFNDPRIKLICNSERLGYVKNFERAIIRASGDVIFFSDQDDVWLPGKVSAVCAMLRAKGCVATDATVVDKNLVVTHDSFFALRRAHGFSWLAVFFKPRIIGATVACDRNYLDTLLPFPKHIPHDFWITLNAALDHELGIIRRPFILYRRHPTTASVSATSRTRRMRVIVTERIRLLATLFSRRIAC